MKLSRMKARNAVFVLVAGLAMVAAMPGQAAEMQGYDEALQSIKNAETITNNLRNKYYGQTGTQAGAAVSSLQKAEAELKAGNAWYDRHHK